MIIAIQVKWAAELGWRWADRTLLPVAARAASLALWRIGRGGGHARNHRTDDASNRLTGTSSSSALVLQDQVVAYRLCETLEGVRGPATRQHHFDQLERIIVSHGQIQCTL